MVVRQLLIGFWSIFVGSWLVQGCSHRFELNSEKLPRSQFESMPAALIAGASHDVVFQTPTSGAPMESLTLWATVDAGLSYQLVQSLSPFSNSFTWTVPTVDASLARLKLVLKDRRNFQKEVFSSWFSVTATPPATPTLTMVSSSLTNSLVVSFTSADCTGVSAYWVGETNSTPSLSGPGWASCTTAPGGILGAVSAGDGLKSVYVFARNLGGLISASSQSFSLTLDQTAPALSLTSLLGGQYFQPNTPQSVLWATSDLHLGVTPVEIAYSVNGGSTYSVVAAVAATPGSYSLTLPATETTQAKVRVRVTDQAGNIAIQESSSNFAVDGTAPVISSVSLNSGATYSVSNFLNVVASATDALTPVTEVRFSTSSTFSNDLWRTFISAGQTFAVPFANGTSTVYVWVKDAAGNISTVNSDSITIAVNSPPSASIVSPSGGVAYSTGNTVQVNFFVDAPLGLAVSNPINLYTTTDGGTTKAIVSTSILNGANGGCVVPGGSSGCVFYTIPVGLAGASFQFLLEVEDLAGAKVSTLSAQLGVQGWKVLAGVNSTIMGQSALSTAFSDLYGRMAIGSDGHVYVSGLYRIYKLDALTNKVDIYVGNGTPTPSGDGAPPSASTGTGTNGGAIAVDLNGKLHWWDASGLRRVGSGGLVERVLGGGTQLLPSNGMLASDLGIQNGADGAWSYSFSFDSQNRLIFTWTAYVASAFSNYVLRLNSDQTITVLAGNGSAANPVPGPAATGTGLGVCHYPQLAVRRGATDLVFLLACDSKIYKIDLSSSAISFLANHGTNPEQLGFDYYRDRIIAAMPGYLRAFRYDAIDSGVDLISTVDGGYLKGVESDQSGGLYYTTNAGQRGFYVSTSNAQSTFLGVNPAAGDSGPSHLAQLRTPNEIVVMANGDVLIEDNGNSRIRKVDSSLTISTYGTYSMPGAPTVSIAPMNGASQLAYTEFYWGRFFYNLLTSACFWACGAGPSLFNVADGGSISSAGPAYIMALTYDPIRNSNFILGYNDSNNFVVSEVTSSGNTTVRLNSSNLAPAVPSGSTLTSSINPNAHLPYHILQAYNGVMYFQQGAGGVVYRMPIGGTITTELTDWGNGYLVDGANGVLYYTNGTSLYKKTLGVGTAGTNIATLPMSVQVRAKSPRANTLIFAGGNQVFEFTDSVNIP